MSSNQEIPTDLASMQSVRELTEWITAQEYSDEKVTESLMFGNGEVCLHTNKFVWETTDPQYHRAKAAAEYFAASHLIPKTVLNRDNNMPMFLTYKKLGMDLVNEINKGLPTDTADTGILIIQSTSVRNYYKDRKKNKPFMVPEGFGGAYNNWNTDLSSYQTLDNQVI